MNQYNHEIYHRRSIRLKGYDYTSCGMYFMTICTHDRHNLFSDIINDELHLNIFGNIVDRHWLNLSKYHSHIDLDEYTIVPNHLHGIVTIVESSANSASIAEIIRGFKTFSAREINKHRQLRGVPVWQRNYFDRVIRTEKELENIRQYIINNPQNWHTDSQNIQP
jgi:putative transposase